MRDYEFSILNLTIILIKIINYKYRVWTQVKTRPNENRYKKSMTCKVPNSLLSYICWCSSCTFKYSEQLDGEVNCETKLLRTISHFSVQIF